jgi:hypothetical protein
MTAVFTRSLVLLGDLRALFRRPPLLQPAGGRPNRTKKFHVKRFGTIGPKIFTSSHTRPPVEDVRSRHELVYWPVCGGAPVNRATSDATKSMLPGLTGVSVCNPLFNERGGSIPR